MRKTLALATMLAVVGCSKRDDGGLVGIGVIPDINPVPAAGGGDPAGPADEIDKLKGVWTGSVLLGDAPGGQVRVEITAELFILTRKSSTISRPYKIDPTKSPKWIDFGPTIEPDPTGPQMPDVPGIYVLDGDKLTITTGYHGVRPGDGKKGPVRPANIYRLTRGRD